MRSIRSLLSLAAVALLAHAAFARSIAAQEVKVKEEKPGLLARARTTPAAARATAQAAVPKGKLASAEIEEEDGLLVFVFSFRTAGVSGEDEVQIDAMSGKLVKAEHESPEDEAREQAADKAKAKSKAKAKPKSGADTVHSLGTSSGR